MFSVINMEKKARQNLIISLICAVIVAVTLYFMYDSFQFQTYGGVIYFDYVLSGSNEQISVDNLEVYLDQDDFLIDQGKIVFNDPSLLTQPTGFSLDLSDGNQSFNMNFALENYDQNLTTYDFATYQESSADFALDDITTATLTITNGDNTMNLDLSIEPLLRLESSNKEYRIENAAVSKSMIRLGSLTTSIDHIIENYPNVSLEYRYLKDENGDLDDNENYVVFTKVSGASKDYINGDSYGTYLLDDSEIDLTKKKLSVVVILSNDEDRFAFAIDLNIQEAGDSNE